MLHERMTHISISTTVLCLAIGLAGCKSKDKATGGQTGSGAPASPVVSFELPKELRSVGGTLRAELKVQYARNKIGGDQVYLRSYNGGLVGPTLRLAPGETLDVTFINALPPSGTHSTHEMTATYNEPHAFNNTNLHTHGLWTDPVGSAETGWGDNALLDIAPGSAPVHYRIVVPPDHPPGTHWYHAHHHGSVALQVSSGLVGALIVTGGLDDVPEIKAATEQVMVFQQIGYDPKDCGDVLPQELRDKGVGCIESYDNFDVGDWQKLGHHTTINGLVEPTITMRPGEVQRWRMIHAGVRESVRLALIPEDDQGRLHPALPKTTSGKLDIRALIKSGVSFMPLRILAEDGIAYGRIDEVDSFTLEPGYRADALIKLDKPGTYRIVDLPSSILEALHPQAEELATLGRVVVTGEPHDMALPASQRVAGLAPYKHIEDAEITGCQKIVFDAGQKKYTINGTAYSDDAPACKVPLDQAQEWHLSATAANHPYHIHVNPFEVLRKDAPSVWKDTWMVRSDDDSEVVIRSRYRRFTGTFVMHCHILDHEDQGMMEKIEIMKDPPAMGTADTRCVPCN